MKTRPAGLAAAFVRNRHLLALTVLIVLVAGLSALTHLPRIEDPRITTRNAIIVTTLPGASPARIESLVTKPIEDRLRELAEIKHIESTSRSGISIVTLELADWVGPDDNDQIFSRIRDKLRAAEADLPAGTSRPVLDDKRGAVAYSLVIGLSWQGQGAPAFGVLSRLAAELADRLRNLPGTDQVDLFGEPAEEITVTVDPQALADFGMTARDVALRVAAADVKTPAGVLRTDDRAVTLEVDGALDSVRRIAAIPLADNGTGAMLTVGDVGAVSKGWLMPPEEIAYANGQRAVLVAVLTEEAVRLDRWAAAARTTVTEFAAGLDAGIGVEIAFDQSGYTDARLASLGGNLLAGAAVVVLVVFLTMGWRAALVVGAALPLSAAASLFGLTFFGEQIHQMSIFGMIVAIGLLIDNAIVVTDAVRVRLRTGLAPVAAATGAVRHLAAPLFASTFTTVLGFMPIFLLPGNVGDFVGPIAIAVVLALVASFALSMTVIPALAALFARPARGPAPQAWWRDGYGSAGLARGYRALLTWALGHPLLATAVSLVLPVSGFLLAGTLGNQFFPPADRDQFEVQVWLPPDAAIHRTAATVEAVEAAIRAHAGVLRVDWVVGGSSPPVYYNQLRNQDNDPSYARGTVLTHGTDWVKTLVPRLQDELGARFPEAQIIVEPFGQGPPISAPIVFRIVGPDADRLRLYGEELRRIMHAVPAITHTRASIQGGRPKLWLAADERQARLAGLTLAAVADQFQTALEGAIGGTVLEDLEALPVRVRYGDEERASLARIAGLRLVSPEVPEGWIPAAALGEMALRPELASITRRNGERVNTVEGFIREGALPIDVASAVQARLEAEGFVLAPGYRLEVAGDSAEQRTAVGKLLTYVPVLAMLMIATLVLTFRSVALAGMITIVGALSVGLGLLALWVAGFPIGFNPIIGSAGLIGVAINGSIIVLAAIRANPRAYRGESEAIVGEVMGATRHIVSTTLTTVVGFVPLLVFSGGDFWPPLATVIAGGVGLAITLALVLTPALYRLWAGVAERARAPAVGRPGALGAGSMA